MTHEKSPRPKPGLQKIQGIEIEAGLLANENIHMGIISDSGGPLNHRVVTAGCAARLRRGQVYFLTLFSRK